MRKYKTLLTIAGSDSIGGAGIQADIKTATALGVYAMSAVTAVTAQNSSGVKGAEYVSAKILELQLDAVFTDFKPNAVKIGMVPSSGHASVIADALERYSPSNIVVDTVMSASSGIVLSTPDAVALLTQRVYPMATLITPNIPEAEILLSCHRSSSGLAGSPAQSDCSIESADDQRRAAEALLNQYRCKGVLVKGGHLDSDTMTDILAVSDESTVRIFEFAHPRIATANTHGTGCTLSSAIASFLALGFEVIEAVRLGIDYLEGAIRDGAFYSFGRPDGHGPVNHMHHINHQINRHEN